MIHAIPFKVVHPCPRPRAVPPCVTTTSTGLRPSPSTHLPLSRSPPHPLSLVLSFAPSRFSSSSFHPIFSLTRSLARSLAHSCLHTTRVRTHARSTHTYTHTYVPRARNIHMQHAHTLALVLSPYWLSIPACNDSMALPHPCASNQCYCFIVPLLLLLLDTRKGDPSIPRRSGTPRRVARLRFASPRLVSPYRAAPRADPKLATTNGASAEPSRAEASRAKKRYIATERDGERTRGGRRERGGRHRERERETRA